VPSSSVPAGSSWIVPVPLAEGLAVVPAVTLAPSVNVSPWSLTKSSVIGVRTCRLVCPAANVAEVAFTQAEPFQTCRFVAPARPSGTTTSPRLSCVHHWPSAGATEAKGMALLSYSVRVLATPCTGCGVRAAGCTRRNGRCTAILLPWQPRLRHYRRQWSTLAAVVVRRGSNVWMQSSRYPP